MKLAMIVPYRDRLEHLKLFVPHIKCHVSCDIIIVHQCDDKPFNRAKLLNIGFIECGNKYDYICTHDIDMLPGDDVDYSFPDHPTHLAGQVEQFGYSMPFPQYFGGVVLFTRTDFIILNGYSNNFWGWGGEDNEMFNHVVRSGLPIAHRPGRFRSLPHTRLVDPNQYTRNLGVLNRVRQANDGLTGCTYRVKEVAKKADYMALKVII